MNSSQVVGFFIAALIVAGAAFWYSSTTQPKETEGTTVSEPTPQGVLLLTLTNTKEQKTGSSSTAKLIDPTEVNVRISSVELHKDGKWVDFEPQQKNFELLSLENVATLIGTNKLEAGKYTQIRFKVDEGSVKLPDGTTAQLKVPSEKIRTAREFTIEGSKTTALYIDFGEESIVKAWDRYILKPVVKLKNVEEFARGLCNNKEKCDDKNPCTEDMCSEGICKNEVLADGTACGKNAVCTAGNCAKESKKGFDTDDDKYSVKGDKESNDEEEDEGAGDSSNKGKDESPGEKAKGVDFCSTISFETTGLTVVALPKPTYLYSMELADLDEDKDVDIAIGGINQALFDKAIQEWRNSSYVSTTTQPTLVKVYFNDGKGNFADSGQYLGTASYFIDVGDIDGDSDKDIVAGGNTWGNQVNIFLNNGNGGFTPTPQKIATAQYIFPKIADMDKDADLDIYMGTHYTEKAGKIFLNDGKGNFSEKTDTGIKVVDALTWIGNALFADIDNDNDNDLVELGTINLPSGYVSSRIVRVHKNDGSAKFSLAQEITGQPFVGDIAAADMDNDGDIDLETPLGYYANDGKGFFSRQEGFSGSAPFEKPFGHADRDKYLDITSAKAVHQNDGTGNILAECVYFDIGTGHWLQDSQFGDVDNDGDEDIVSTGISTIWTFPIVANETSVIKTYLNNRIPQK